MKTSKIIFISLLGSVALLILATTIDIKLNGHPNNTYPSSFFKVNKTGVTDYKVLLMTNCSKIELIRKDTSSVEVIYPKDSLLPDLNYTLKDDTLIICNTGVKNHSQVTYKIQATGSLRQIIMKDSYISFKNLGSGNMSLELDKSSINMNNEGVVSPKISSLNVSAANHSSVSTGEFRADSLNLDLKKSEAYIEIIARRIHGTLKDSSLLNARQPYEVYLKKDSTSSMSLNAY
jgi:hypothetical protein